MAKLSNSPKQALNFDLERRKSFTFRVRLKYSDGSLVNLTGCTIRFVMKSAGAVDDHFDLNNLVVNSEATIGAPHTGEGVFAFQAAELDGDPGEYDYSIVLWSPDNFSTVLAKGFINLLDNSESHSMHRLYSATAPTSALELTLRGGDVVEVEVVSLPQVPVPIDAISWPDVGDKPESFPPSTHGHTINEVTGLATELAGKQPAGNYAASAHQHTVSDVDGLQTVLDGKSPTSHNHDGTYAPATHGHTIANVTGLQGALDAKAASSHGHTIANVTGLQGALDGKQPAGSYAASTHTHTTANITDFTEAAQDIVGTMVAGAGGTYNDAAGTITLPSGGGGSASELTPVTAATTTPPGSTVGNLVGYVNTASAPITVNGQSLAAGAWAIFGWSGSAWVQMNTGTLIPTSTPVTATAPTFNDASGTASDTYTIPTKVGVEYLVGGTVTAAGTYPGAGAVTITAQATSGYTLTGTSSWSHTFSTATDPTPVTPTGPTWTDDTVNGGGTWTTPTQTGVTYSPASGTATPGQSVTVTATAQSGYTLSGTTSWSHTFPNAPSSVTVTDTFNRADNPTSLGTTETGGKTWQIDGGTWGITSGKAAMLAGSAIRGHASVELGGTNMSVEARMNVPAGTNSYPSIAGRYANPANCYMLQNSDSAGENKTVLVRIGGVNTFLATSLSIPSNGLVRLTLVEEGSDTRVRVYADGVEVWSGLATMAGRPNGTEAGLFAYTANAGVSFDDFKAELL